MRNDMGELHLTGRAARRSRGGACASRPPTRELLLRSRLAVDVSGRRAGRSALRRCALAAGRRRRPAGRARRSPRSASAVEERADELQLPLVWPEAQPAPGRSAMRVAALAAERGRAAEFVLAASRLAFCGGYDVDDPEILAEAAAAAGPRPRRVPARRRRAAPRRPDGAGRTASARPGRRRAARARRRPRAVLRRAPPAPRRPPPSAGAAPRARRRDARFGG